jgi:hypothetical protein
MSAAMAPSTAYTVVSNHEVDSDPTSTRIAIPASTASIRNPIPTGRIHVTGSAYWGCAALDERTSRIGLNYPWRL